MSNENNNNTTNEITSENITQAQEIHKQNKLTKKQEIMNVIKFVLFSISAGVIQIVSFTLLSELVFKDTQSKYGISYFISLALSVLWNFTFNRKFTFKSASNVPVAMLLVLAYYAVFTPISIFGGEALIGLGWNEYLVLFITMVVNMATEFLWTRFVVYRKSINSAVKPKEDKVNDIKEDDKKANDNTVDYKDNDKK